MSRWPIKTVRDRFEDKYIPEPNSGCWLWTGSYSSMGYGQLSVMVGDEGYKKVGAHRLSWMLHRGSIPDGMHLCHKCDNPACCNPDHLFLGTHADNMRDASEKGKFLWKAGREDKNPRGEAHPRHKLTFEDAEVIRASMDTGRALAKRFSVSEALISMVRNGQKRMAA